MTLSILFSIQGLFSVILFACAVMVMVVSYDDESKTNFWSVTNLWTWFFFATLIWAFSIYVSIHAAHDMFWSKNDPRRLILKILYFVLCSPVSIAGCIILYFNVSKKGDYSHILWTWFVIQLASMWTIFISQLALFWYEVELNRIHRLMKKKGDVDDDL